MVLQPRSFIDQDVVKCKRLRKDIPIFSCMSMYVDANALAKKSKACFACQQGVEVRTSYAAS